MGRGPAEQSREDCGAGVERGREIGRENHHDVDSCDEQPRAGTITPFEKFRRGGEFQAEIDIDEKHGEEHEASRTDQLKGTGDEADRVGESGLPDELLAGNVCRKQGSAHDGPARIAASQKKSLAVVNTSARQPRAEGEREGKISKDDAQVEGTEAGDRHGEAR